jgi:DNA-binding NarL/FixJ family response regulator
MAVIRVLIVDDHPVLRRGLRSLLSSYQDIQVVGEAEDGAAALQAATALSPDVILLDVQLPGPDGAEVAYQLRRQVPEAKIIILTAFDNDEYVVDALRAGVHAYLLKNTSDETVVDAVRQVHQGVHLLSPALMETVLGQFGTLAQAHARYQSGLSEEELGMLELIARGATTKEIGAHMHWSERTVKRKVEEAIARLGAKNRAEAVAQAIKSGLI